MKSDTGVPARADGWKVGKTQEFPSSMQSARADARANPLSWNMRALGHWRCKGDRYPPERASRRFVGHPTAPEAILSTEPRHNRPRLSQPSLARRLHSLSQLFPQTFSVAVMAVWSGTLAVKG